MTESEAEGAPIEANVMCSDGKDMKKRTEKLLHPTDEEGNKIDMSEYGDFYKLLRIGEKRTHKFALESIRPSGEITIKEALAAAYVQGLTDTVLIFNNGNKS